VAAVQLRAAALRPRTAAAAANTAIHRERDRLEAAREERHRHHRRRRGAAVRAAVGDLSKEFARDRFLGRLQRSLADAEAPAARTHPPAAGVQSRAWKIDTYQTRLKKGDTATLELTFFVTKPRPIMKCKREASCVVVGSVSRS
jgi:hypothetical protein